MREAFFKLLDSRFQGLLDLLFSLFCFPLGLELFGGRLRGGDGHLEGVVRCVGQGETGDMRLIHCF
jgi:hypothetical protein